MTILHMRITLQHMRINLAARRARGFAKTFAPQQERAECRRLSPPAASVTIALRPSSGVDGCGYRLICDFGKSEYFFERDWTGRNSLSRFGKLDFARKSVGARGRDLPPRASQRVGAPRCARDRTVTEVIRVSFQGCSPALSPEFS